MEAAFTLLAVIVILMRDLIQNLNSEDALEKAFMQVLKKLFFMIRLIHLCVWILYM